VEGLGITVNMMEMANLDLGLGENRLLGLIKKAVEQ